MIGAPHITKQEWIWLSFWITLGLLITSLPYIYGWTLSTPEQQFSGFIIGIEDANSYLAKMRLGAEGNWKFHLPFTAEPHDGAYLYTFHLLLGKFSNLFGLEFIPFYHLARLLCSVLLLTIVYYFIAFFITDIPQRRFAFLLIMFGSGLGWLISILGLIPQFGLPIDFYLPEAFIFLVIFHLPHLALAEGLLFCSMLLLLHSWHTQRWIFTFWAGIFLFLMCLITAFYYAVFASVMAITWAFISYQKRKLLWPQFFQASLVGLMALPVIVYDFYVVNTNPVFQTLVDQIVTLSPHILHYGAAYGLLILLAVYGLLTNKEFFSHSPYHKLLVIWVILFPLLVYLPFNLQRRLVVGVQVPLVILATVGIFTFLQKCIPPERHTIARLTLIVFFSFTNIFILLGSFLTLPNRDAPIFQTTATFTAVQWLDQTAEGDVVLTAYDTGNILPAYAYVRTFVGHGPETVNSDEKRALVKEFFASATTDAWRINLIESYNVKYLYFGETERQLGSFDPEQAHFLEKIYDQQGIQIFQIQN